MGRSRRRKTKQLPLRMNRWGGPRPNSGRKRTRPGRVPHECRQPLASRFPVHVTLKTDPSLGNLRTLYKKLEECLRAGKVREGFRLVHFSVQAAHLHLIVEAVNTQALGAGIKGLSVRLARGINKELGRKGRVFIERYHAHILRTPRETKNALCYVLNNVRRHASQRRRRIAWNWIDHCSSGRYFDGWSTPVSPPGDDEDPPIAEAKTWLLITGWRRHRLLSINAIPGD